jgi:hypothetical protein
MTYGCDMAANPAMSAVVGRHGGRSVGLDGRQTVLRVAGGAAYAEVVGGRSPAGQQLQALWAGDPGAAV